ncbi:FecR family protein [Verrucomicrobiales bacterium BCK34]|nr:FecR family protein [Verrucomicrobiales bacterium BCK34]
MKKETEYEAIDFDLPGDNPAINERIKTDPEFRREFTEHWLLVAALDETLGNAESASRAPVRSRTGVSGLLLRYGGWAVAALLMFAVLGDWQSDDGSPPRSRAQFTELAQVNFFGELVPPVNSNPDLNRNYSLVSGSVQLAFPDGATAIIEGPAVFRVVSDDRLALDTGHCSVHAPEGAEGFRVDTPTSRIIDRGTRFSVNVSELNETEVQVVEGAADVYPEDSDEGKVHLRDGSAQRIGSKGIVPVAFSAESYRHQVPDRVVSYEADFDAEGRAKTLTGLSVQRGGRLRRYKAADLTPIELVSFTPEDNINALHVFGDPTLPERRATLIEDLDLNGGIINPGGSPLPLSSAFDHKMTPGFGIRFRRPVLNGPGPDVVFFEVQNPMHPPEGDPFHVSPLVWSEGLRSHTIRRYDLMMPSSEALLVSTYSIFHADEPITSAADLESTALTSKKSPLNSKALAVGIDLSDLGYEDGAEVAGLFFQDANDDGNHIDPIVIRGLPIE